MNRSDANKLREQIGLAVAAMLGPGECAEDHRQAVTYLVAALALQNTNPAGIALFGGIPYAQAVEFGRVALQFCIIRAGRLTTEYAGEQAPQRINMDAAVLCGRFTRRLAEKGDVRYNLSPAERARIEAEAAARIAAVEAEPEPQGAQV